jgi:hypothetical protein
LCPSSVVRTGSLSFIFSLLYRTSTVGYVQWLEKMRTQVNHAMPYQVNKKRGLPDGDLVKTWALGVIEEATKLVADYKLYQGGGLNLPVAREVQRAVVVGLVVGALVPPIRLFVLKTMDHPHHVVGNTCSDPECLVKECQGSRIEPLEDGSVKIHVCHGKTEGWQKEDFQFYVCLPPGQLADLIMLHVEEGHEMITSHVHESHVVDKLFTNNNGKF